MAIKKGRSGKPGRRIAPQDGKQFPGNPADHQAAEPVASPHQSLAEESGTVFSVVGIGASAGGIEALKEFLGAMPSASGMAFVVVQHLEPTSESRMAEILGKCTLMKVVPAEDGMPIEPNVVYTNPPGRTLSVGDGRLVLGESTEGGHVEAAIDCFLISLAEDQGSKAICRQGSSRRRRGVHGPGAEHRAVRGNASGSI